MLLTEEQERWLFALWQELRSRARRGAAHAIDPQTSFNSWLSEIALMTAAQIEQETGEGDE